jgi:hypothetical protein
MIRMPSYRKRSKQQYAVKRKKIISNVESKLKKKAKAKKKPKVEALPAHPHPHPQPKLGRPLWGRGGRQRCDSRDSA